MMQDTLSYTQTIHSSRNDSTCIPSPFSTRVKPCVADALTCIIWPLNAYLHIKMNIVWLHMHAKYPSIQGHTYLALRPTIFNLEKTCLKCNCFWNGTYYEYMYNYYWLFMLHDVVLLEVPPEHLSVSQPHVGDPRCWLKTREGAH